MSSGETEKVCSRFVLKSVSKCGSFAKLSKYKWMITDMLIKELASIDF